MGEQVVGGWVCAAVMRLPESLDLVVVTLVVVEIEVLHTTVKPSHKHQSERILLCLRPILPVPS